MVLPSGTTLPPLVHGAVALGAAVLVAWALVSARARVDARVVLGLSPWMAAGATGYVLYQVELLPAPVAPLFGSPTVYVTATAVAGVAWLLALRLDRSVPRALFATGAAAFVALAGVAVADAAGRGALRLWPSVAATAATAVLAAAVWVGLTRVRPETAAVTGAGGALAVVGHALDAVSTAVGVGSLGVAEQTPLSRVVIETGAALLSAPYVGGAWLFVLTKLAVAAALVLLFADYVRDDPTEGFLALAVVAALGLGPGVHNVVLFAVTG